jgi:hypothetical protein
MDRERRSRARLDRHRPRSGTGPSDVRGQRLVVEADELAADEAPAVTGPPRRIRQHEPGVSRSRAALLIDNRARQAARAASRGALTSSTHRRDSHSSENGHTSSHRHNRGSDRHVSSNPRRRSGEPTAALVSETKSDSCRPRCAKSASPSAPKSAAIVERGRGRARSAGDRGRGPEADGPGHSVAAHHPGHETFGWRSRADGRSTARPSGDTLNATLRARRRKAVTSDRPRRGARRRQSISAKKIVTPPVAKFGMSLTAACPSSDPRPAWSASMSSNVSSAMRW